MTQPSIASEQDVSQTCVREPDKSWSVALALALFVGVLGADRFYTRHILTGLIKLVAFGGFGIVFWGTQAMDAPPVFALATTVGFVGVLVWTLIDVVLLLVGRRKVKGGKALTGLPPAWVRSVAVSIVPIGIDQFVTVAEILETKFTPSQIARMCAQNAELAKDGGAFSELARLANNTGGWEWCQQYVGLHYGLLASGLFLLVLGSVQYPRKTVVL